MRKKMSKFNNKGRDTVNILEGCRQLILTKFGDRCGKRLLAATLPSVTDHDYRKTRDLINKSFPEGAQKINDCLNRMRRFNSFLKTMPKHLETQR